MNQGVLLKLASVLYRHCFPVYRWLYFRYKRRRERFEARLLKELIRPGSVVLDIGSNIGFYTRMLASLVGERGTVHAFEPEKVNFRRLQEQCRDLHNVRLNQAGVSDETGEIEVFVSGLTEVDHRTYRPSTYKTSYVVSSVSIDDYFSPERGPVDFIKMDIQGAELKALDGMRETVERSRDLIIFTELWPHGLREAGGSVDGLLKSLGELGLSYELVENDGIVPLGEERVAALEKSQDFYEYSNLIAYKHHLADRIHAAGIPRALTDASPWYHQLPITKLKLWVARNLYRVVGIFVRNKKRIIERGGIRYSVDLTEGMDLSVFLFGRYQQHVLRNRYVRLPPDAIVVDIGANCGFMTLQFARLATEGHVFCFEPTHDAFTRLQDNIGLNPELAERITSTQAFVSSEPSEKPEIDAYSSWKVDGKQEDGHPLHGGRLGRVDGVPAVSLDDYCRRNAIDRVDFIKIDTDGHELDVLKGAKQTMRVLQPLVVLELGLYLLKERGTDFETIYKMLCDSDYTMRSLASGRVVDLGNYRREIPLRSAIDVLATPKARSKGQ